MRKLINTLLFGLLYLNLYAQTDKMELNPKHDKALYPKVFEYIRDTLLGGYPIGGTEKDMQNWAQNEFDNHFSFEYGHSNYASTLYEKRSYFLVKNAIQYDFSLVSSKSHVLLMLSNDDAFVEQIELHLTFNTAEDKIIYYEKVIYQLKSVFQFPISHVGTGTYTFDFEEGSVFITGYDLSDQRMSIRFRANEKQSKKTLAPTRYLKEKKLISGNEEPLSAEKALRLSLQRWKIDSINVKNENNKNPNCPNRCLRYNGESDCMYFSPFAYKGNSVEVLFARPKVAKKRELTESIVNFTSILKIDYKNIKEKTPTTEGIIELALPS